MVPLARPRSFQARASGKENYCRKTECGIALMCGTRKSYLNTLFSGERGEEAEK